MTSDIEARLRAAATAAKAVRGSPDALVGIRDRVVRQRRQARVRYAAAAAGLVAVTATAVVALDGGTDKLVVPPTTESTNPTPTTQVTPTPSVTAPAPDPGTAGATDLVTVEHVGDRTQLVLVSTLTGTTTKLLRFNVKLDNEGYAVDLAPDRKTVYYGTHDSDHPRSDGTTVTCGAVHALTLGDGVVRRVEALGKMPRVSPDGRWLAMVTGCPADHLTIVDLRTGAKRSYPLAPTLTGQSGPLTLYRDPVRDYTWTADGTLALLGWASDNDLALVRFDPATDRRIADGEKSAIDSRYWQLRARGDDLLLAAKYQIDVRDGRTGAITRLVSGGQETFLVGSMGVGPDGTAVYERHQRMWFVDASGRERPGPAFRGSVADW